MNDKYAMMSDDERNDFHRKKMEKKKQARDKMLAKKQDEKGLIMVNTGKCKGKSTAAMGLAIRAMGNSMPVGIVQFVKGAWDTGERHILDQFPDLCTIKAMGEGFTWDTQDRERDIMAARKAWDYAKELMADPHYKLCIFDELNIVLRYDYLPIDEVLDALHNKRDDLHVMITGRNAHDDIIELADMVTDFSEVKHHFRQGIKAQIGIEF